MQQSLNITGQKDLKRDIRSFAVVNTNHAEYTQSKMRHQIAKSLKDESTLVRKELETLKDEMKYLKEILKGLLNVSTATHR